jgi:hypothetical protein
MKQRPIILRLLLPADQNWSVAIPPTGCPLHHPAAGLEAHFLLALLRLFATPPNRRGVVERPGQLAHFVLVIPLVQADPWRMLPRGLRTPGREALPPRLRPFPSVALRSVHGQAPGNPSAFPPPAARDALGGSLRRIRPGFFSRPVGLGSARPPSAASPSAALSTARIPSELAPRTADKRRPAPLLKPRMRRGGTANPGVLQRVPRAAGSPHQHHAIPGLAVWHTRSAALGRRRVLRQQGFELGPEALGYPVTASPMFCLRFSLRFAVNPWRETGS